MNVFNLEHQLEPLSQVFTSTLLEFLRALLVILAHLQPSASSTVFLTVFVALIVVL
ncbi:hypothetical protein BD769DRAFT_1652223 [Suillus cothurnatus]|nr:hypothetical protein BD769DRAFT_1652223 [Suillus cothurnatus]